MLIIQDHHTPSEFGAFRETLLSRLRQVNRAKGDADKRIKEQESKMEQRMGYVDRANRFMDSSSNNGICLVITAFPE